LKGCVSIIQENRKNWETLELDHLSVGTEGVCGWPPRYTPRSHVLPRQIRSSCDKGCAI